MVFLPPGAKLADQPRRFHANGVDPISLTAARRREAAASGRGGSLWPWSVSGGAYLAAMAFLSGQLRSIDRECLS
jgi:hypothetical protein